jgi:hypothetical protein
MPKTNPILAAVLILPALLGGCGTYTPDFQEFWGTSADNTLREGLIVEQVKCELIKAFQLIEREDIDAAKMDPKTGRRLQFLDDPKNGWVIDAAFLFTIDEKTSLSPGASVIEPLATAVTEFPGIPGANVIPPPKTLAIT